MTLIDTSIWVNHFRRLHAGLVELLEESSAAVHPFVIGELACGNLRNRTAVLGDLSRLPQAPLASEKEVHTLVETRRLWGSGLGWVDVHILASALLAGWELATADAAMREAAKRLGVRCML